MWPQHGFCLASRPRFVLQEKQQGKAYLTMSSTECTLDNLIAARGSNEPHVLRVRQNPHVAYNNTHPGAWAYDTPWFISPDPVFGMYPVIPTCTYVAEQTPLFAPVAAATVSRSSMYLGLADSVTAPDASLNDKSSTNKALALSDSQTTQEASTQGPGRQSEIAIISFVTSQATGYVPT